MVCKMSFFFVFVDLFFICIEMIFEINFDFGLKMLYSVLIEISSFFRALKKSTKLMKRWEFNKNYLHKNIVLISRYQL